MSVLGLHTGISGNSISKYVLMTAYSERADLLLTSISAYIPET
jgi:hypothetical protein